MMAGTIQRQVTEYAEAVLDSLDRLGELVSEAVDRAEREREREQLRYVELAVMVAAGDTDAQAEVEVPAGAYWLIERVATTCTPGGDLAVYLDNRDPRKLIDYDPDPSINARDPKLHAGEGRRLLFHFYNVAAGDLCTVNLRVRQLAVGE